MTLVLIAQAPPERKIDIIRSCVLDVIGLRFVRYNTAERVSHGKDDSTAAGGD